MKNFIKWFGFIAFTVVIGGSIISCQTTVPVRYTEPARLNLSGINRIAIDSNVSQVGNSVSQILVSTGKYTIASEEELSQWKLWNYQQQAEEVNSADLVQSYANNVANADNSYKGKLLVITSPVQAIDQSPSGSYFIRFEGTGNNAVAVFFNDSEIGKIRSLSQGQTVTVIGECTGRTLPDMSDTAQILQILGGGQPINIVRATFQIEAPAIDAVMALSTNIISDDGYKTEQQQRRDGDGKPLFDTEGKAVLVEVRIPTRTVNVTIDYQVVRAQNGSSVGRGSYSGKASDIANDPSGAGLSSFSDLRNSALKDPLDKLASDLVPTERFIAITLQKESENKDAKKEMSAADQMVKKENYVEAAALYGSVYAKYKNFAAGYNHAVLTEATAGTAAAIGLMEALVRESGNPLAQTTLSDMQNRNRANQAAAAQLAQ